ncbi:Ankyrin repeat domain-containing protein 7 [Armadillidium nasatum]|uniref:Ankyrin repeat domain-containing protein 7 n=1 Tax=Armadillidium nasatum TaxID=96803 RepID=A0A5N5T0A8_9CRUS|nr:Ankyrin repeat domain-containing protein 7 [Armadillidium nasatum]
MGARSQPSLESQQGPISQFVNQGGVVQYSGSEDRVTDTPMTAIYRRFDNINPGSFLSNEDVEKQLSSPSDHNMEVLQPVDQCNIGLDPNSNRMGARSQPSLESQQGSIKVGDDGEWTILHKALTGNTNDIKILLKERKDIKKLLGRSSKGEYFSQQEMKTLLKRVKFDVNAQNNNGETMIHLLGNGVDVNLISLLLQLSETDISIKDNEGRTPLLSAISSPEKMQALLEGTIVDVNAQDDGGKTLLHHAAYSQSSYVIKILLEKGADVNVRDNEGRTPLHIAVKKYNQCQFNKPFNVLLRADGIDVNIQDNEGRTALHDIILIGTICDKLKFEALLKVNEVDVNIQDNEGKTPLHLLADKKN